MLRISVKTKLIINFIEDVAKKTASFLACFMLSKRTSNDNYDMPRENVVSYYASDIDDCEMSDDPDPTTPLDYRRHWSFERQNKLQVVLLSNALLQESIVDNNDLDDDDMMDCKSIASIDVAQKKCFSCIFLFLASLLICRHASSRTAGL
jgi:hypothetical protein